MKNIFYDKWTLSNFVLAIIYILWASKHFWVSNGLFAGTREQAVVHALASSALVWEVSKACAKGDVMHCSCGALPTHPPDGEFKWGGCGDNIKYGMKFGGKFVNAKKKKPNSNVSINKISRLSTLSNNI